MDFMKSGINKCITLRKMTAERMSILTARELIVLKLSGEGYTGAEIAVKLWISDRTIDAYKSRTVKKLKLKNRSGYRRVAFKYAVQCLVGEGEY